MRRLNLKAGHAGVLCGFFLFQVACGPALAETADAPGSAAVVASPADAAKDAGPFGGCEPIGMTASGELVFPLECKHVLRKPMETPVASDDKATAPSDAAPTAEAKPADVKPAAAEDRPAAMPEKAAVAEPHAAVETKSAAAEAKPETKLGAKPDAKSAEAPTAAIPEKPAVADKAPRAAQQKTAEKVASNKSGHHAARTAAPAPAGGLKQFVKQLAMARPSQPSAAPSHVDDKPPVRTAGMPACVHFRSYNPTSKSYLGYDGHTYACR
jgi:hypothetical protein